MGRFFHKSAEGNKLKFGINYYGNFFTGRNNGHSWIVIRFFIPYGISIFPYFYSCLFSECVWYGRKLNVFNVYVRRRSVHSARDCGKRWIFRLSTGMTECKNRKLHRTIEQIEDENDRSLEKALLGKPPLFIVREIMEQRINELTRKKILEAA